MDEQMDRSDGATMLSDYVAAIRGTDVLPENDHHPVLMGLFGEVGGIMSTTKKHVRERRAFPGFKRAAEEEFGDTLWYLAAYCRRVGISLDSIFQEVPRWASASDIGASSDLASNAVAPVGCPVEPALIDDTLFRLGRAAATLCDPDHDVVAIRSRLEQFAHCYLEALHASQLKFADIIRMNSAKVRGAFLMPDGATLPTFDDQFDEEERIPSEFCIRINQRHTGHSYLRWNDVFIGDPLTDNIADPDGYRFHDVFHFSHAAILHWSPVFRALIKQKRKSKARYDEIEDGGRAIVVEEGLSAWIFARAKELNYFEGQDRISFSILKTIQDFTAGYEVSQCPLKLWERAILDGYGVFRQVRDAQGGWVIGDRKTRTIRYESL